MKKILFTILLSSVSYTGFCQSKTTCCAADENEGLMVLTDKEFNTTEIAFIGNDNEFIGSYAGVDMNNISVSDGTFSIVYPDNAQELLIKDINDKHENLKIPAKQKGIFEINGTKYHMIVKVQLPQGHQFASLTSIAKEQGIDTKGNNVLYMINERIISTNIEGQKIDKSFVLHTEIESSKEIDSIKQLPEFKVLRIYTKTQANQKIASLMRIR